MIAVDDRRPAPPCPAPFSLAHHVLWGAGASDDRIALAVLSASGAERWSYGRLRETVLATAGGLRAAGLEPGDRLLMRIGHRPDFPITFLAAVAAGVIPVPTSAQLNRQEITGIARRLAPKAVTATPGPALPDHPAPVLDPAALARAKPLATPEAGDPDRPAYIVFTSGTAREPQGVLHAHRAVWARGRMIAGWSGLTAADRLLHAGAFNWTYTLGAGLFDPWATGGTALIPAEGTSPALLPLLMKRHDATIFAAVPGVFRRLLRSELPPLPALRHALTAGEKLPESLRDAWQAATGTRIHEAFGQTECSTFVSGCPGRPAPRGTLGFAQPGRRLAILGPDGPAERGERGEIAIDAADPGLMLGYLDDAEATQARQRGGWFTTGDSGAMNADGSITYLGRADDLLTAGGYRVSPLEVEAAMLTHPGIREAAAVDCRVTAETTVIALYYTAEADIPEIDLASHAAKHLARYKQPRLFTRLRELPRNPNGKLLRARLRGDRQAPP